MVLGSADRSGPSLMGAAPYAWAGRASVCANVRSFYGNASPRRLRCRLTAGCFGFRTVPLGMEIDVSLLQFETIAEG